MCVVILIPPFAAKSGEGRGRGCRGGNRRNVVAMEGKGGRLEVGIARETKTERVTPRHAKEDTVESEAGSYPSRPTR